jgi:hypothetical protein
VHLCDLCDDAYGEKHPRSGLSVLKVRLRPCPDRRLSRAFSASVAYISVPRAALRLSAGAYPRLS